MRCVYGRLVTGLALVVDSGVTSLVVGAGDCLRAAIRALRVSVHGNIPTLLTEVRSVYEF